jgi:hypothetical protein
MASLSSPPDELSPLRGGNLENGGRAPMSGQAAWAHPEPDSDGPAPPVEEHEIEAEAHAEGMDAGAARQQQARSSLLQPQPGEA